MFKRAALRQHQSDAGTEVPRSKRRAQSEVQVGRNEKTALDYYGILTIERDGAENSYLCIEKSMLALKCGEYRSTFQPTAPHPFSFSMGDLMVHLSSEELVVIRPNGAHRLILRADGSVELQKIVQGSSGKA